MRTASKLTWWPFAATTLLGAFLVFQVQPVISKAVLPWFGGSPAVWTTCMLFFQVLLFAGYLYAHLLTRAFNARGQGLVHVSVLCAALLVLPIGPSDAWKPVGDESPILYLLKLLLAHVGLPYFVLASTGPLTQAWFTRIQLNGQVYRLYALSNLGSLAALISYPFLVEPFFATHTQSSMWSVTFCSFALLQGLLAITLMRAPGLHVAGEAPERISAETANIPARKPSSVDRFAWIALPAFASVMLLAVTNHVSQEVAVIPFLWVVPLSLYLLTFIICFDRPAWYRAKWMSACTIVTLFALPLANHGPFQGLLVLELGLYLGLLFLVCLLCHGELARLKPTLHYLTQYYLMLSGGGALGGMIVALLCPQVFNSYFELPIALAISAGLALVLFVSHRRWDDSAFEWSRARSFAGVAVLMVIALIGVRAAKKADETLASERNFFGVLKVAKFGPHLAMLHGQTVHGLQLPGDRAKTPTTYYAEHAGLGRLMRSMANRPPIRIGAVGLGCGTLAVYGRPGDEIDFIEINPAVIDLANEHFGFMKTSAAKVNTLLGDGRLVLEAHADSKPYDVIVLDAFSSDAIPAHLLTVEAMQVYRSRLKSDGVLAFHVTNRHLNLAPVVHRLAKEMGWQSRSLIAAADARIGAIDSHWVVISANGELWNSDALGEFVVPNAQEVNAAPLWTDQYHDLLRVFVL